VGKIKVIILALLAIIIFVLAIFIANLMWVFRDNTCNRQTTENFQRALEEDNPGLCLSYDGPVKLVPGVFFRNNPSCIIWGHKSPFLAKYNASLVEFEDDYRVACVDNVARLLGKPAHCDLLGKSRGDCIVAAATRLSDLRVCDELESTDFYDYCIRTISGNIKDSSSCLTVDDKDARDSCFVESARATSNYSVCDNISQRTLVSSCYSIVASQLQNISVCEQAQGVEIDDCIRFFADKDPIKCTGLVNVDNYGSCIYQATILSENYALCDKILDRMISEYDSVYPNNLTNSEKLSEIKNLESKHALKPEARTEWLNRMANAVVHYHNCHS
jgi:hypothetical protein